MKSTQATRNVNYTKLSIGKFTLEREDIPAREYFYQQYDKKRNMYFPALPYAVELPIIDGIAQAINHNDLFFATYAPGNSQKNLIGYVENVDIQSNSFKLTLTNVDTQ